jgi:hypothetical protein
MGFSSLGPLLFHCRAIPLVPSNEIFGESIATPVTDNHPNLQSTDDKNPGEKAPWAFIFYYQKQ